MNNMMTALSEWWQGISPREQKLLSIGGLLILIAALYWGIIAPQFERATLAQNRLNSEKQLNAWVYNKADEIATKRAQTGASAPRTTNQPLNQLVSSSVRRFNIELIRVQPRGDMVQAWVQPLPFNQLVNWIDFMQQQYGVSVAYLDLDAGDAPGVVEVKRIQFKKAQ